MLILKICIVILDMDVSLEIIRELFWIVKFVIIFRSEVSAETEARLNKISVSAKIVAMDFIILLPIGGF